MPILNRQIEESIAIRLPKDFKATALPKPTKIEAPFGSYQSSHAMKDGVLQVERSLTIKLPHAVMSPEEYPAFRNFANAVTRDLRAPVAY